MPTDSGNPQPADAQGTDSAADFAAGLRELRAAAGSPSFRHLAKITHYSSSALAEATSGKRLPSEALVRAFAAGCGADPGEWAGRLQRAVAGKDAPRPQPPPAGAPGWPGDRRTRRRYGLMAAAGCLLLAAGVILGVAYQAGRASATASSGAGRSGGGKSSAGKSSAPSAVVHVSRASDGADPHVAGCYNDGRLAAFANPMIKQVPIYTDVIVPRPGGCLAAQAVFYPAHHAPVTASVSCQLPAGTGQGTG